MAVTAFRWFRLSLVVVALALMAVAAARPVVVLSANKTAPPEPPTAKDPADTPPPKAPDDPANPPIQLLDGSTGKPLDAAGLELDPDTTPFAVIGAKAKAGPIKWLVHVDGYDKPIQTYAPPSTPVLVVAVPRSGFVLVTAISAVGNEPFSAQTRVKAKGAPERSPATSTAPGQKLDINLLYNSDNLTPEVRSLIDGSLAQKLAADGHVFHHYDYRSQEAVRRKLKEIVTRPGSGGLPALIVLDKEGAVVPEGKPLPVPATGEKVIELVRKVAG
jgi:hypothetical protein